nr:hypothetical protein [Tanacetum cinerariifolium]
LCVLAIYRTKVKGFAGEEWWRVVGRWESGEVEQRIREVELWRVAGKREYEQGFERGGRTGMVFV